MSSANITPITIAAPGFYGLNTQDSAVTLEYGFASTAENCVIDSSGRLAARKGWTKVNAANATLGSNAVEALHEYVKNDGTTVQLSIGNKNIFTGTTTLSSAYTDAAWTGNNWKVVNFNNKAYFFQRGHDPLYYDGTTLAKLSAHAGYTGTVPTANEVLSAYGRLWVADTSTDKVTVTWSDTLAGHLWTAGTSGSLNLHSVFTNGTDQIVALAAFNGFLVILCANCVIIYQGADDPASMSLYDVIDGIGCVNRDTVQDIGSDLLFLSTRGLVSLGRLIQEKSAPINDLSKNVRDTLMGLVNRTTDKSTIKSVYSAREGFYLIAVPQHDTVFCFDLRFRLEDGALRVTTWTSQTPTAFCTTKEGLVYMGKPGYVGQYTGYLDDTANILMKYYTNHINANDPVRFKLLKKLGLVVVGGANATTRIKWSTDYSTVVLGSASLSGIGEAAEYAEGEYGIGEYGTAVYANRATQMLSGSGVVFQIGVESEISGYALSIQQLDIYFKLGRGR